MTDRPAFQQQQYALTAHIRDPAGHPAPAGIEDRRLAIYRDLLFNNVESLLAQSFPVLRKIYDDARWQALVRDYFRDHKAKTPYFMEVPQEFLRYLQEERHNDEQDAPFLLELAHYEWVELAVSILPDDATSGADIDRDGDLRSGVPVASTAAWSLVYSFPVHRIGPGFRPAEPGAQPTWLVVYRTASDAVRFLEINAVTARLIELIKQDAGASGEQMLEKIAAEMAHPRPDVVIEGGLQTLAGLREHGVILGVRRPPHTSDTGE